MAIFYSYESFLQMHTEKNKTFKNEKNAHYLCTAMLQSVFYILIHLTLIATLGTFIIIISQKRTLRLKDIR